MIGMICAGQFAEIGAEDDVGDMRGDHGEAQAGRQRDAEQQFERIRRDAILTAASPWPAWICTASGKNAAAALIAGIISVCRTRSRAGDIFAGIGRADEIGDHEAVGDAGDRKQRQRQRQRQAGSGHGRQAVRPSNLRIVPRQAVRDCTSTAKR